jgi:hypothetical protein
MEGPPFEKGFPPFVRGSRGNFLGDFNKSCNEPSNYRNGITTQDAKFPFNWCEDFSHSPL